MYIYYIIVSLEYFLGAASEKSPSCWQMCVCHDSHQVQVTVSLDPPSRWSGQLLASTPHMLRDAFGIKKRQHVLIFDSEQIGQKPEEIRPY